MFHVWSHPNQVTSSKSALRPTSPSYNNPTVRSIGRGSICSN